jgi:hypothetical protein
MISTCTRSAATYFATEGRRWWCGDDCARA